MKNKINDSVPMFSVVIPVYNKELYVGKSIGSVLKQTLTNFELIVVCDPSTDNSNEEVRKFSDSRMQIFYRDKPGPGGYAARNLGIEKATGKWIAFLDADDEWFPNHLESMKNLSDKYPNACFMGCGWETKFKDNTIECPFYTISKKSHCFINIKKYLELCLKKCRPVHTSVACVKAHSEAVRELFPSETAAKRGGDLHAWLKMVCHHRGMAWSNHIGARYNIDIEGQIVKVAPASTCLYNSEMIDPLRVGMNKEENNLLNKYINYRIFNSAKRLKSSGQDTKWLAESLSYKGDLFNAVLVYFFCTAVPSGVVTTLRRAISR